MIQLVIRKPKQPALLLALFSSVPVGVGVGWVAGRVLPMLASIAAPMTDS